MCKHQRDARRSKPKEGFQTSQCHRRHTRAHGARSLCYDHCKACAVQGQPQDNLYGRRSSYEQQPLNTCTTAARSDACATRRRRAARRGARVGGLARYRHGARGRSPNVSRDAAAERLGPSELRRSLRRSSRVERTPRDRTASNDGRRHARTLRSHRVQTTGAEATRAPTAPRRFRSGSTLLGGLVTNATTFYFFEPCRMLGGDHNRKVASGPCDKLVAKLLTCDATLGDKVWREAATIDRKILAKRAGAAAERRRCLRPSRGRRQQIIENGLGLFELSVGAGTSSGKGVAAACAAHERVAKAWRAGWNEGSPAGRVRRVAATPRGRSRQRRGTRPTGRGDSAGAVAATPRIAKGRGAAAGRVRRVAAATWRDLDDRFRSRASTTASPSYCSTRRTGRSGSSATRARSSTRGSGPRCARRKI